MPATVVWFYRERGGDAPVLEYLRALRRSDRTAYAKCLVRLSRLAELGHELRRPEADLLRDGIYELRIRSGRVNHRILYFFRARNIAIAAHALTKEAAVPTTDLDRAIRRRQLFEADPDAHTLELDLKDA